ncbi:MAG: TlpA family protein disulfide reductase [Verrucomicrobia bacterium]|nr:TlpA family protein disulfide reductase [Verrucomicrobiota bacterium]
MAVLLFPLGLVAEDFSKFKDAGIFWQYIQQLYGTPLGNAASREEALRMLRDKDHAVEEAASAFCRRFPQDPHRWDAKILQVRIAPVLARLDNKEAPDDKDTENLLHLIQEALDASEQARQEATFELIRLHARQAEGSTDQTIVRGLDEEIRNFIGKYPEDQRSDDLNLYRARLIAKMDPPQSENLLKSLTSSSNKNIAAEAKMEIRKAELMRQPLDLSFQAVDGQRVDLQAFRGKVVLVDFWATWCGPCMREVPKVVETYKNLHDRGFEIIGISLDTDVDQMRSVTGSMGMTWHQYCDGQGWQNKLSSAYGINSIPTTWLLDKRGYIRYVGLRGEALSTRIQELQAE